MPWCEDCAKYFAPTAMSQDGRCPTCHRLLEAPTPAVVTAKNLDLRKLAAGGNAGDDDDARTPWHFKLLMVLLVLYFIWRIIDLFR